MTVTMLSKTLMITFLTKTSAAKLKRPPKGQGMKKLLASYKKHTNKTVKQTMKEKRDIENLNFLINLAMVTRDTKLLPKEPKTSTKLGIIPTQILAQNGGKQFAWSLLTLTITSKSLVPPNYRCMKNKWVFKIKHNGCTGHDSWHVDTARYSVLTSPKTTLW